MNFWILKRNDTDEEVKLHGQMFWSDEHDWSALAQTSPEYTLGGAVLIEQGTKLSGRPITLVGQHARIQKQSIDELRRWSEIPELMMTLIHPDGRTFNVCFDRPVLSNIEPIKMIRASEQLPTDQYRINIHLITI